MLYSWKSIWSIYYEILSLSFTSVCFNLFLTGCTKIVEVTKNQDVYEHSEVTLSCNATGKPEPNITWTRVWENGTDSGPLSSKDGNLFIAKINRRSRGTYRCTAFNGVGESVNQTMTVIVRCKLPCLCNMSSKLIETLYFTLISNILSLPVWTCFLSNLAPGSTFNQFGWTL